MAWAMIFHQKKSSTLLLQQREGNCRKKATALTRTLRPFSLKSVIMNKKKDVLHLIAEQSVMPLYFYPDKGVSIQALKALYKGGVRLVEYTNRGENALENFRELRKVTDKELPGLKLGAGTIKNKIDATEFINEGADFIVS